MQYGGFLLNPPGIGDHHCRPLKEVEKIEITERFRGGDPRVIEQPGQQTETFHIIAGAWVDGEDKADFSGDIMKALQQRRQGLPRVHIGRSV